MKRNYTVDTLRTTATLFVILLHVSAEYVISGKNNLTFDKAFWIGNIVDSFTRICVPLFVLISGMFLIGRNETFKQSYEKRANRILTPLIFWTILYTLFKVSLFLLLNKPIEIKSLFLSIFLGKPFYHMWYLYMLIGLYLITPVINNIIPLISRKSLWIVAIILLCFGTLNNGVNIVFNNQSLFLLWFIDYLGYFILGYLIKDYKRNFSLLLLLLIYTVSSLLIAVLSLYTIKVYDNLYFYGYLTPLVIIASLSFYKIFLQLNLKENLFSKIAHLTFGIYLIHAGVLYVFVHGLKTMNINTLNNPVVGIPVKFCVTLFISIIIAWGINKIKSLKNII
ncbi:acyltransferase family protein [Tenacibaculum sp. 1_MG-2023]|uniref:acyltransferase n=1 Tax=Tenacibaculum sp. 1_MG-2023 TaxID=3062653 RepID=UPI0026E1630A|nr:acyltransferase family protein [Tenacibaculum sp. 1_MG-2023]MDO6676186.1 acyltransferase family protein [Tenacibaculum sp. 1_MG-2023]